MKLFLSLLLILYSSIIFSQEIIKEEVSVINRIVYVRVFDKEGNLVRGLKRDDFLIYEDNKRVKIDYLKEVVKKIKDYEEIELESNVKTIYKPRFFALVFNITDYNKKLIKGVNHIFDKVLRENDRIMIMANDSLIEFANIKNKEKFKNILLNILKKEAHKYYKTKVRYLNEIRSILQELNFLAENQSSKFGGGLSYYDKVIMFLNNYLRLFHEFRNKFLTVNVNALYNFSEYLSNIKMKKWIINFYQMERFPYLKKDILDSIRNQPVISYPNKMRMIHKLLSQIEKEQGSMFNVPSDEISKFFNRLDTTFHLLLMYNFKDSLLKDMEYKKIVTDLEKTLKDITTTTGGDVVFSNDLEKSINRVIEKEDILYMLSYAIKHNKKNPKIMVKLKNKDYRVNYDPYQFADYMQEFLKRKTKQRKYITIENINFDNKILKLKINNIYFIKSKGGKIFIEIKIKTDNNKEIFNDTKELLVNKPEVNLKVKLKWLKEGFYYINLRVVDLLNKTIARSIKAIIVK